MKRTLFLLMAVGLSVVAFAQNQMKSYSSEQSKLDAYTKMYLDKRANDRIDADGVSNSAFPKAMKVNGKETVLVIITLNDENVVPDLQEYEAEVKTQIGDMLIVRIPVDNIVKLPAIEEIKAVELEQPMEQKNYYSRIATNQNSVNEMTDNNGNLFKGKGVVVGIVDSGIDYNNINFKDEESNSRVKLAMVGDTLYTAAEQIADLTADKTNGSHGNHVAGSAAGSYTGNELQGMAPEADLALCGLENSLTHARILLACQNVVNYAKNENKPAVINLSLGNNRGAHNGNTTLCNGLKSLSGEGAVFVVSAGNEGTEKLYLHKQFTADSKSVYILFSDADNEGDKYDNNWFQIFSFKGKFPGITLFVADRTTNEILYDMDEALCSTAGNQYYLLSEDASCYAGFSKYYSSPEIYLLSEVDGNIYSYTAYVSGTALIEDKYYIGIYIEDPEGTNEVHMWRGDSSSEFIDNGGSMFTAGDASCSINSTACTDAVISAGAYTAHNGWHSIIDDTSYYFSSQTVGDIATFSSYGVDMNGMSHPDVCAPGVGISSSINSYYSGHKESRVVDTLAYNGRTYQWGVMQGTSMSAPITTGIIATWMQYKPTLSAYEIREILQNTSVKDSYVTADTVGRWGAGKIDAYAGLQSLISVGVNDVEVLQDNVLVYPNPNGGQFKVFTQGEYNGATLNVYSTAGTLVYSERIDASQDAVDVDLSGSLSSGVYIVNITGEKVNYSTRMIIK